MFVYLIKLDSEENLYKIGTSKSPKKRLKELQTANGIPLILIKTVKCEFHWKVEAALHRHFVSKRTMGEWFLLDLKDVSSFEEIAKKREADFKLLFENNSYVINKGKF